jgi:sulfoxide reductase heme-binding subunit YedZ
MKGTGQDTLHILLLSLLATPARQVLRLPHIAMLRRMLGVAAMAYGLIHFALYIAYQNGALWTVASEIALRVYLTIGFVALVGLVALGATSTDAMVHRLGGARWRRLHRLAYPIGLLAVVHFILHAKLNVAAPMTMAGLYLWLMGYRAAAPQGGAPGLPALLALAIGAAAATAAMEFAWYGIATGIDPWRVLQANLDPALAPRPAAWVLGAGLAAILARLLRGHRAPRRAPAAPALG